MSETEPALCLSLVVNAITSSLTQIKLALVGVLAINGMQAGLPFARARAPGGGGGEPLSPADGPWVRRLRMGGGVVGWLP